MRLPKPPVYDFRHLSPAEAAAVRRSLETDRLSAQKALEARSRSQLQRLRNPQVLDFRTGH